MDIDNKQREEHKFYSTQPQPLGRWLSNNLFSLSRATLMLPTAQGGSLFVWKESTLMQGLNALMMHSHLYIGGESHQQWLAVVKEQEHHDMHDSLLEIERSIFSHHGFRIGDLLNFDDLPTLYAYYLNAIDDMKRVAVAALFSIWSKINFVAVEYILIKICWLSLFKVS